jgi:hypothetical protein
MVEAFKKELHDAREEGYRTGHEVGYARGMEESFDSLVATAGYARGVAVRGAADSFRRWLAK